MELKNLRGELQSLSELVEGWVHADEIPVLERDLVLEKLRRLYETVRFAGRDFPAEPAADDVRETLSVSIDLDDMLSLDDFSVSKPDSVPEPTPEPFAESDAAADSGLRSDVVVGQEGAAAPCSGPRSVISAGQERAAEPVSGPDHALDSETGSVHAAPEPSMASVAPSVETRPVTDSVSVAAPAPEPTSDSGSAPAPAPASAPVSVPNPALDQIQEPVAAPVPELLAEQAPEPKNMPVPESAPKSAPVAVPSLKPEPDSVPNHVEEPSPKPVSAPEPAAPTPKSGAAYVAPTLFGLEEETVRHRHKQRVIMSLYDNEPARPAPEVIRAAESGRTSESVETTPVSGPEPSRAAASASAKPQPSATVSVPSTGNSPLAAAASASQDRLPKPTAPDASAVRPNPNPTPAPAPVLDAPRPKGDAATLRKAAASSASATGAVLGEVINHNVQTLSDTIAPPRDVASALRRSEPVTDLRKAIGINDKFLMIRDLFGGDGASYEIAIRTLNGFDNLDDCMIYIAENYAWNANSDGAKLLMELLERKYA